MSKVVNRRFEECLEIVLLHEGGYVDHARDPGGATNRGITLRTLRDWRGDDSLGPDAVRALTLDEASQIYLARYWNPIRGDELPPGLDLALFDFAVNSGIGRAVRTLQQILGVPVDGAIGRQTLAAIQKAKGSDLVSALCGRRMDFLRSLPNWSVFGRGWGRRVVEVQTKALERASRAPLTIQEAITSGTGRGALGVGAAGVVATVSQAAPVIESLGTLGPIVGVALVVAASALFILWRQGRL